MMSQQLAPRQLQRVACLYVRQSTLQQVFENTESTARQYALRERALALGLSWAWRPHASPAAPVIGITCSRSVRSRGC
jgi:hypothetical protein